MKLSPHFHLVEFLPREGGDYPAEWIEPRLKPLVRDLEMIRAVFDRPLRVTSAYRTPAHNAAVGGAPNSQHVQGQAVDFVVDGLDCRTVYGAVEALIWAKVIEEGGLGLYSDHVHLDHRDGERARWVK